MLLLELFQIDEIEKYTSGGDLNDDWDERTGEFAPDKMGVPEPPDPDQHDMFPDAPKQFKPGVQPTAYLMLGHAGPFTVGRPRVENDDEDVIPPQYGQRELVLYVLFDDLTPVGYVKLDLNGSVPEQGSAAKVKSVRIDKAYAGRGISLILYRWVLRNVCDWIEADDEQTAGGAKIWEKMVLSSDFKVFSENLDRGVDEDGGEWHEITNLEELEQVYEYQGNYMWVTLA